MRPLVRSAVPVTLVGGGPVDAAQLNQALALAPTLVAADGGADAALAAGYVPQAVIGDFDSLSDAARRQIPEQRLHPVPEQDSTDFHKCLARIDAPLVVAVGFAGGRMDHLLAVFNVLVRLPTRRCIVLGQEDLCVLAPPRLALDLSAGTVVSLFPMAEVTGQSTGLHWPLDGLRFAPYAQSGTSNRADGPVEVRFDCPGMLLLLPHEALPALLAALQGTPTWC